METLRKPPHPHEKHHSKIKNMAATGALVTGILSSPGALAQQNPDPVPLDMSQALVTQINENRIKISAILRNQKPSEWIVGSALLATPFLIAGGLIRREKQERKKKVKSQSLTAGEILDTLTMPSIAREKNELYQYDPLLEAKVLIEHKRPIDALLLLSTWIEQGDLYLGDNVQIREPGYADFVFLLKFITQTDQLDDSFPTLIPGKKNEAPEYLPGKKELYDKFFRILLGRSDITLAQKALLAINGMNLDPKNSLYREITQNSPPED